MHIRVMVTGDRACFTQPEFKVERYSYEVPTPSALEGMLKSIYWKPAIRYVIDKIIVFNPISMLNVRRNEVSSKLLLSAVKKQMKNPTYDLRIDPSECRNQRNAVILQNVKYGVEFHIELTGIKNEREAKECDTYAKHISMLQRRLERGQWFRTPVLGCKEFPVKSIELVDEFPMEEISPEILNLSDVKLGRMLYGLTFLDKEYHADVIGDTKTYSDKTNPIYYYPHMKCGVIDVSSYINT